MNVSLSSLMNAHIPLGHCKSVTYAADTVTFTSSNNFDATQGNLSQDLRYLSKWFRDNELIFNLKNKGKTEVMLFGISKQLNLFHDRQVNLLVNGSPVNTTIFHVITIFA